MRKLTYTRCGDYYIPDLKLSDQPDTPPIGKYDHMRQRYLKEYCPGLYCSLILSENCIRTCWRSTGRHRRVWTLCCPRMMEAAGVTEELKARDPMRWVGLMNTLKAQVEEVILHEVIFL